LEHRRQQVELIDRCHLGAAKKGREVFDCGNDIAMREGRVGLQIAPADDTLFRDYINQDEEP